MSPPTSCQNRDTQPPQPWQSPTGPTQPTPAALAEPGSPASLPGPGAEPSSPGPRATSTSWCCHSDRAGTAAPTPWPVPCPAARRCPRPGGGAFLPTHPAASSGCRAWEQGTSAAFLLLPPLHWAPAKEAALPGDERSCALPTALGTQGDTGDTAQSGMMGVTTWGFSCPPQPCHLWHPHRATLLRGVPLPGADGTGDAGVGAMAWHCTAQHGTVHHSTAWYSAAQLGMAWHSSPTPGHPFPQGCGRPAPCQPPVPSHTADQALTRHGAGRTLSPSGHMPPRAQGAGTPGRQPQGQPGVHGMCQLPQPALVPLARQALLREDIFSSSHP